MIRIGLDATGESLDRADHGKLPGRLGLMVAGSHPERERRFEARSDLIVHTGCPLTRTVLSVADISRAHGGSTAWPDGATRFTTADSLRQREVTGARGGRLSLTAASARRALFPGLPPKPSYLHIYS